MIIHTQLIIHVCVVMMQNPNVCRAKNIKKILEKHLKNECQLVVYSCRDAQVQHLVDSMLAINYLPTSRQRFQRHASVFRRKTESTNYTFQSYLQIFGSDSKLSHLDQESEKDWTFKFFKNKYVCLIMTGNDRLEKVTPSLELVRISNHAIKGMIEANYWKNRSKLFQPSEINHVV